MIAIPWYFAKQGELDFFLTFYIFANILLLFWVPYSGTLVDKYDRKKVFLSINLVCGFFLGIISWIGYNNGGLSSNLVALVFIMTFLNYSIHYPCLYAFVQEITTKSFYGKISSILEVQGQSTNIIAGAFAVLLLEGVSDEGFKFFGFHFNPGFSFEAWKIHEVFMLDCATYFVSLMIISAISYVALTERKPENFPLKERLKIGWKFLANNRSVFLFGVFSYMIFVALMLEAFFLGAAYVDNHLQLGGDVYAASDIAYSIGALLSGFTIRIIFRNINIPLSIIILMFLTSLNFMIIGITNGESIYYLTMFLLGVSNAGTRILRVNYLFNNVPNQYFGRAASIFNIANIVARISLLSLFTLSFFHQANNIIYAYLIVSVLLLISSMVMIFYYRTFDLKIY